MAQLSSYSADDAELIVSLPYRVAIHVSYADDEDGEQDDEREMRAITAFINEVLSVHKGPELTRQIAAEILDLEERWPQWQQGVFNIEPLCERAVLALKAKASEDEVKDYIKMVLELASAVAQAYGEFGEEEEDSGGFFASAMKRIVSGFSEDDANHPMNISAAEDTAISSIAAALKKNA